MLLLIKTKKKKEKIYCFIRTGYSLNMHVYKDVENENHQTAENLLIVFEKFIFVRRVNCSSTNYSCQLETAMDMVRLASSNGV